MWFVILTVGLTQSVTKLFVLFITMAWQHPGGSRLPHYRGFTIILRHTTVGRTPLDEWSVRRRNFYLKTHNTHNRQTSISPVGFEPTIPSSERPQTHALDRAATGTGMRTSAPPQKKKLKYLSSKLSFCFLFNITPYNSKKQIAIISLSSITSLICIIGRQCVYWALGNAFLCIILICFRIAIDALKKFAFKWLKLLSRIQQVLDSNLDRLTWLLSSWMSVVPPVKH